MRSKYSSKGSKSSSSPSKTSVKSNESLTEKAKIFADQIEEQAKRKLELIKKDRS